MAREIRKDLLRAFVYSDRQELGKNAGIQIARKIRELQKNQQDINIIFAAAPSQEETLHQLRKEPGIDWNLVNAFHMDEYVGLPENAPQRFGKFLKERIFGSLPFKAVYFLNGNAADMEAECSRYASLLQSHPADIVCMGIGENTHIAFNDPHVSNFNDPKLVKVVDLDLACRQQQVNDGCFVSIVDVPSYALTLTVPALFGARHIFCMVPGVKKAQAVYLTFTAKINDMVPSSVLRKHESVLLFLDEESAGKLPEAV
jgi:glucosamine-6-phosphate deaminase